MSNHRLNIVSTTNSEPPASPQSPQSSQSPLSRKEQAQARFERLWLTHPEQFDPNRDCLNRERINRTWHLFQEIQHAQQNSQPQAVDLGCGYAPLSFKMRDQGYRIDAVDIASNALKRLQNQDLHNIQLSQEWIPKTRLKDDAYDIVLCTEVIAELSPHDYRLFFAELARLVKREGIVIFSTALDIHAEDALERLQNLAETELLLTQVIFSHHRLYIRFSDFFALPHRLRKASKDAEYRYELLTQRRGLSRLWFRWNSSKGLAWFWGIISTLTEPIHRSIKQSTGLLLFLEKICRFIWAEAGISHVIFAGKRKPLEMTPTPILGKSRMPKWE